MTPLRRGLAAQFPDFPNDKEIDERAGEREKHHRDADGVLMEAARGSVDSCRGRQCAEPDGDAHSADGDDGGAGTLQYGEENSRPIQQFEA